MKENIVKSRYEIKLSENGDKKLSAPSKIQLLRSGAFEDFFYGTFEVTPVVLKEMVKNFKKNIRGVDLAIDIAHQNDLDAAGWIKDLEVQNSGNELWAEIEWTDLGREKIESKRFRYLSAEYSTQYVDNESGKKYGYVLLGAGLTNRPFIKNMMPTTQLTEEKKMEEKIKTLEESNVKLSEELKTLTEDKKTLSEKVEKLEAENKELNDKIISADKEKAFDKMLSEGKAVPAQKEAWMKNDLIAFAENAVKSVNFDEKGSGESKEEEKLPKNEENLISDAKKLAEEKEIKVDAAISELLDTPEYKHLNK